MERYIGIDKTKIKSFILKQIDSKKLFDRNNSNVIYKNEGTKINVFDLDNNIDSFSYLKITDGKMFNTLVIGLKINKAIINIYSFMEIHISDKQERNLIPLKVSEYHKLIDEIADYLRDRYGLYIDFTEAKFDEIEINVTAQMKLPFESYEYLLNQMVYLTPKIYSYSSFVGKNRITNQFEFFNKSVEAKIYDKSRQLYEVYNINLNNQYMRIEYKLIKPSKIKKCLGTEYIYKLNDNSIKRWIKDQIDKDLIKPIIKHIEQANKKLYCMAKEEIEIDCKKWTRNFINKSMATKVDCNAGKLNLVTDLKQIENTIKKLTSRSNISRTKNRTISTYSNYKFAKDSFEKLEEIMEKFTCYLEENIKCAEV